MKVEICGKQPKTAALQDALINELIALASAAEKHGKYSDEIARLLADGLFTTLTNVNFDDNAIEQQIKRAKAERLAISDEQYEPMELFKGETDIVSLRSALLFGMKGMAAYAHHAMNLGYRDDEVFRWFIKGISEIKKEHTVEQWLDLLMEFCRVNFKCMELLDSANTGTFGNTKRHSWLVPYVCQLIIRTLFTYKLKFTYIKAAGVGTLPYIYSYTGSLG